MAVRYPLYESGGNLYESSSSLINDLGSVNAYDVLYRDNPVSLTTSPSISIGGLFDTRVVAGGSVSFVNRFPTEGETPEPFVINVFSELIYQSITGVFLSPDNNLFYPAYYDNAGNIRAMTFTDMLDTFVKPWISQFITNVGSASLVDRPYMISTSLPSGSHSLIGLAFNDTNANVGAYSAAGIPETQDQPYVKNSYYVYKRNYGSLVGPTNLGADVLYVNSNGDLIKNTSSYLDSQITLLTKWALVNLDNYRLRYGWNAYSISLGSAIDSRLNGSGNYQTRLINENDYRAQEFPDGSSVNVNTYTLTVGLV